MKARSQEADGFPVQRSGEDEWPGFYTGNCGKEEAMRKQSVFLAVSLGLLFLFVFTISADELKWRHVFKKDGGALCIAVVPTKPVVYVGTPVGVYKTENRGKDWVPLNRGFDPFTWVYNIAIHPDNPDIMYAGCSNGFHSTTDAGLIWKKIRQGWGPAVAISRDDTRTLYMGNFKSTDNGNTWESMGISRFFQSVNHYAIDRKHPEVIYATDLDADSILKSTDSGATWNIVNKGGCYQAAIDPVQSETVYTGGINELYKSVDAGKTWELIDRGLPKGASRPILIDPIDHKIIYTAVNEEGVFSSENSGKTWEKLAPIDDYYRDLAINPSDPDILYAAANNGVWLVELESRQPPIQPSGKLATTWGSIKDF